MEGSGSLVVLVLMVGVFYFLLIRPQQRRMKTLQSLQSSLQLGDEIITSAGFFGTIRRFDGEIVTIELSRASRPASTAGPSRARSTPSRSPGGRGRRRGRPERMSLPAPPAQRRRAPPARPGRRHKVIRPASPWPTSSPAGSATPSTASATPTWSATSPSTSSTGSATTGTRPVSSRRGRLPARRRQRDLAPEPPPDLGPAGACPCSPSWAWPPDTIGMVIGAIGNHEGGARPSRVAGVGGGQHRRQVRRPPLPGSARTRGSSSTSTTG